MLKAQSFDLNSRSPEFRNTGADNLYYCAYMQANLGAGGFGHGKFKH
jgi:hypothetical protein